MLVGAFGFDLVKEDSAIYPYAKYAAGVLLIIWTIYILKRHLESFLKAQAIEAADQSKTTAKLE